MIRIQWFLRVVIQSIVEMEPIEARLLIGIVGIRPSPLLMCLSMKCKYYDNIPRPGCPSLSLSILGK